MSTYKSYKPKKINRPNNFIEALKDIGSSFKAQAKDATFGAGRGAMDQIFGGSQTNEQQNNPPREPQKGELKQQEPFNFEDFLKSRERQIESIQKQRYERQLKRETMVFHRKEEEVKEQIKAIQEELKKLAEATTGLSQEVKKAVFAGVAQPGSYHIGFFDRIRQIIEMARKQIADSSTWLHAASSRKKQKSFYWGNVKKSGTRFMLSHERYMSTQSG